MSTDADFLIALAGRLHYEPSDAKRLMEIANRYRRLEEFADWCLRDAIRDAREAEQQASDGAAKELARVSREHNRNTSDE